MDSLRATPVADAPSMSAWRRDGAAPCYVLRMNGGGGPPPVVNPVTLSEQIADHLGHRILRGEFRPGERLKEIHLAAFYGVSRGPVREALRLLEGRGLAHVVPRHGAQVRRFDIGEIDSLFSIRAVLLGLAARQAVERGEPSLIPRLEETVEALRQSARDMAISPLEHATITGRAQYILARRSGNVALAAMLEDVVGRAYWRMVWNEHPLDFTDRRRRWQSARLWNGLLRAVKKGDAARAEEIAREITEASRLRVVAELRAIMGRNAATGAEDAPSLFGES